MIGLDNYSVPARLFPAILVLLPFGLSIAILFPQNLIAWGAGSGFVSTTGLALLMAEHVRRRGRAMQDRFYERLGAKPTTIMLRHRDNHVDAQTKNRYHDCLGKIVSGITIPTAEAEAANPKAADATYESCTKYLLEQTRDRKVYPLVFKELVSYGMIRNLRSMKPVGIALAVVGLVACTARALWYCIDDIYAPAVVAAVASAFLLATWLIRLNDRWVEDAAFDYAQTILASCETLGR